MAGTVALEDMGFKTFGFAGGRSDDWEPERVDWGPESKMLGRDRQDALAPDAHVQGKTQSIIMLTTDLALKEDPVYLGDEVPQEALLWQDPVPAVDHPLIDEQDIAQLKCKILESGLGVPELVRTAWASASTFRGTDMRGGANGARLRLAPQKGVVTSPYAFWLVDSECKILARIVP